MLKGKQYLKLLKGTLDAEGIPFFLTYGTCMGLYRDGDFLPEDDDVDLGVLEPISLKRRIKLGEAFEDLGFHALGITWNVKGTWVANDSGYQGNKKTGIIVMGKEVAPNEYFKFTVFFFYDDGEDIICVPRKGVKPVLISPNKFYKKFDKILFNGDEYNMPSPVIDYLEWTYEDWKDPTKRDHGKLAFETHKEKWESHRT